MPTNTQTFDFETMAVVLYAMLEAGVTLGDRHYQMMSDAVDGARGKDGFNHQFRRVKARATELQMTAKTRGGGVAVPKVKAGGRKAGAGGRRNRGENGDEEAHDSAQEGEETTEPACKRVKGELEDDADVFW